MPCGFSRDTGTSVTTTEPSARRPGPPRGPARRGPEAHRELGHAAPPRDTVIILKQLKQGRGSRNHSGRLLSLEARDHLRCAGNQFVDSWSPILSGYILIINSKAAAPRLSISRARPRRGSPRGRCATAFGRGRPDVREQRCAGSGPLSPLAGETTTFGRHAHGVHVGPANDRDPAIFGGPPRRRLAGVVLAGASGV